MTQLDAVRLAQQATFGPSEPLVAELKKQGPVVWLQAQMALPASRYTSGGDDAIHKKVGPVGFCDKPPQSGNPNCWRDYYSTEPLVWDFYRNATSQPDQLRQRMALALHQILVVSGVEIAGTYGFRVHHNTFSDLAFGNYREVLRKVARSPLMGDYLDHVNNDKFAPNENFARELLQLFALGTCQLNADGGQAGKRCRAVYDNAMVRNYAYALTGWTYPKGGNAEWGCWPQGANCQYYGGDMVAAPALRDAQARPLLSGLNVPAGADAATALDLVLDSLMAHDNMAPFIGRQLIQQLVTSNPSPAYVKRVANTFRAGKFKTVQADGTPVAFGKGKPGDLAATVAAILLDTEARDVAANPVSGGKLRSPALLFTGSIRGLNGITDGAPFSWWIGETLKQHVFRPPSVFSYYSPSYPLAGTQLLAPEFGIHNANGALNRLNHLTYLIDWGGSAPDPSIPGATGTSVKFDAFLADAADPALLVDRLSRNLLGQPLASASRDKVITAVAWWTSSRDSANWQRRRVAAAAWLIMSSPDFQVQR
jgi:uncharacterized protein (DUF1800 family)